MGFLDQLAISGMSVLPHSLMRRFAARYIAGEHLDDALAEIQRQESAGFSSIIDILGEDVQSEAQARGVASQYMRAAESVRAGGHDTYVSIKPTHVGLSIDRELALELYLEVARHCADLDLFVRVEMEDHPTTEATVDIFDRLRRAVRNVGIVLQSRLFRTPGDIDRLAPPGSDASWLSVRMVKGIYLEPAKIAFVEPEQIRQAYIEQTRTLLSRGAFVSLATHDDAMAESLFELIRELGVGTDRYEMQVLLGVRSELWESWREAGHPVRVYVPYGPEWRPYSLRRLRKNPQIFRHVLRDTLSFGRSR